MVSFDLHSLSDAALIEQLRDLRLRIGLLGPQIEPAKNRGRRTRKILRCTFLTAGGFFVATIDPLGLLLVLFGGLDWVETISDDAATMNRDLALRRQINELRAQLDAVEVEMVRRGLSS
jgi:hypothetical protein